MQKTQIPVLLMMLLLMGAAPAMQPLPPVSINRSDFTAAQFRADAAYAAHPPADGAQRARLHRAMDQAFMLYYGAKQADAIRLLNDLTYSLEPATTQSAMREFIDSLQVRLAPQVALRNRPGILRLRIARMYPVNIDLPVDMRLVIRTDAPDGKTVLDVPIRIEGKGPPFSLVRAGPEAAMGQYLIELVATDGTHYPVGRWTVVEQPLDLIRLDQDRHLHGLAADDPEMRQAVTAALARNSLLTDHPDENNTAQYLADPLPLLRQVQSEVQTLLLGRNPYGERVGDWWRAILAGGMSVPARVYAPPQVQQHKPLPLIIALQGGGGDENTFFEACGHGRIKQLADQYGFIVAAPNTLWLNNNLAALDSIVTGLGTIYNVDPARVYLIGHAYGATVAAQMAARNPGKVAGIVMMAGGDLNKITKLPRTRLYSGELDALFPPQQAQAVAQQAQALHLPVELTIVKDSGNMLLVDDKLDEAVQWLIEPR